MAANSKWVVAGTAAVVLVGASFWYLGSSHQEEVHDQTSASSPSDGQAPPRLASATKTGVAQAPGDLGNLPENALLQHYACKGDASTCANDPLVASTAEEAVWLQAHGYPTPDQVQNARSFSTEQLKAAAEKSGSAVDASLYAQGLLREQRHREALGVALDGARQGNLYGLYLASDIYLSSDALKNLPLSMAYLRLAYLAGDSKAGPTFAARFPNVAAPELASADKRAAELKSELISLGNWPRP